MGKENIKEIVRIAQVNHKTLTKQVNSKKGKKLSGKWVAVAKKKVFSSKKSKEALQEAKKIEPNRERILLAKIPDKNLFSVRF